MDSVVALTGVAGVVAGPLEVGNGGPGISSSICISSSTCFALPGKKNGLLFYLPMFTILFTHVYYHVYYTGLPPPQQCRTDTTHREEQFQLRPLE
jgi:hypothetical protein